MGQRVFCCRRMLASGRCIALGYTAPRRRSSDKARRRRLVLALSDGLRCGTPARRRRNPDAATGAGLAGGARPAKRPPKGAWPCGPTGWPRATAGGWQAPQGRRPEPPKAATSRHNSPTAAGGRGGRRPCRPGWAGVAARRPLGAGGTRPEGADGSPHQPAGLASLCLAVSSTKPRGRRVGRAGTRPGPLAARPKGRAQTEAATRPRPGARAEAPRSAPPRGDPAPRGRKKVRPSGRAICYLEPYRAGVVRS